MDNHAILILMLVIGTLSLVDSYRADFIPGMPLAGAVRQPPAHVTQQQNQQGCEWSTVTSSNSNSRNGSGSIYPRFLQQRTHANYGLDCHVRTLNADFWTNYAFNRDQLESTSRLNVKCNDKLFFESVLEPSQSFFRLRNLQDLSLQGCKIRTLPTRIFSSLGFLKSLKISSRNGEWSSAVGMDIETGAFDGLTNLETLDLSQCNIQEDKNVFCPLRSLLKVNMSMNRLTDLGEFGFGNTFGSPSSGNCAMKISNLDLSFNSLRHVSRSAFSKLRRLIELWLHRNLIEVLEDDSFEGLTKLRLLNLSSNRLVALPPSIFKGNPGLSEINLSNNSISALAPDVFSGLTTLLSLDLSQNKISQPPPQIFKGLVRLIVLKLSHNELSYVDATMFKDLYSLQALKLDSNRIESINPVAFQSLTNLHHLDLTKNRLSIIDSRHFSNLFVLKQLYIDHNALTEIDDDALKNCTRLQDLGLAGNKLGPEVPVALRNLRQLVTVDIGENKIEKLSNESFLGCGQLYGIRIVENLLTDLPSGLCDPVNRLRVLNVAQNKISTVGPAAFSACPDLRALRLDANNLQELPATLSAQLPSILWLNVSKNSLKWADYHVLPPSIEWLDLSWNELETIGGPVTDGGKAISYSLRVADFSYNKLTSLDYTAIPPTLETLRLSHNRLKRISPDTFARSTRLIRVDLVGNEIENLPLSALRFPPVEIGKPLPEFYIGKNPLRCDCSMEWLTRASQLSNLRQHPRIVDLDAVVCRPTFTQSNQLVPLVEMKPKDFLCPYKSHCFALCECCEFDACDCEMTCPNNCTCYHDTAWSANIVQCSNSQFSQLPARIPMDATELYLDGNHFQELTSHIFIGKKNLRVLYLNNSGIETIKNKSFNGLKSLEVLRLDENKLTALQGFEFAEVENLKQLYLHNNMLRSIAKDTFSKLPFLEVLRLDSNFLVDYNVWELSGNKYLNSVMLANNPWSCDCEFLIPFRVWASGKSIVVDFSLATCQPVPEATTVGSNDTDTFYGGDSATNNNNNDNINVQQLSPQLIRNMCDHNKELNFNFNPNDNTNANIPAFLESELLNSNHISAEKVASSSNNEMESNSGNNHNSNHHHHNYPSINDISSAEDQTKKQEEGSELWTIFTSVLITLIIVLLVIAFILFRKDSRTLFPLCLYSWFSFNSPSCCYSGSGDDDTEEGCNNHHRGGFISFLFQCCCGSGGKAGKKSRSSMDDADKLFDAYFIYSQKDEDLLVQKIAPELEGSYASSVGTTTTIPPPPPPHHHGGNSSYYRLCLHYRDLCLSSGENPSNIDMILSACDASKRVVLVISRPFLLELSHPGFRSTIQTAINRYQNKLIFLLLPPFTEQNMLTIYPELKAGHFTTMTMTKGSETLASSNGNSQITSLEWSDKKFWSKLKLILPTPTVLNSASSPSGLNSTSTISSTGSSAIFNMAPAYHPHHHTNLINYNNALSLHEYAYNTINSQHHQYHRNILPFNGNTPPVPKHHIALTTPAWQQQQQLQQQNQNFYNNSQHSQIIPIPGYPGVTMPAAAGTVGANTPLMVKSAFPNHQQTIPSFNESFRRHLQLQQSQNKMMTSTNATSAPHHHNHQHHLSNCSSSSQGHHPHHHHHHHHQGSHCSSSHSSSTSNNNPSLHPYQPLDANYSSSSSNEELLDHVYSTLDSPPIMSGSASSNNNGCCESNSELISKQVNNSNSCGSEQVLDSSENSACSRISPPLIQNRLSNINANCPVANNINNSSGSQSNSTPAQNPNGTNNNGTMYFV